MNSISSPISCISLKNSFYSFLQQLQQRITEQLSVFEHKKQAFTPDSWERPFNGSHQGQGITCILENGEVFERAGVAFSHIQGVKLPPSAVKNRPELVGAKEYEAMGLSLVLHPRNPFIPTVHLNIRGFMAQIDEKQSVWWFGGGMDLTPYYPFIEDCQHFHQVNYQTLQPFNDFLTSESKDSFKDSDNYLYRSFKKECDEYFYLPHRQEARGIGGIFFDDFDALGFDKSLEMTKAVGNSFLDAYVPIVEKRMNTVYTDHHKKFQCYRRGRYVEFNLVFDRGTLFGLQSQGRTESILLSMPPQANWIYQYSPEKNSLEEKLYTDFLPAQEWIK
jgi:coproporphyrinogen III oxidase